jgi:hypothetical protein
MLHRSMLRCALGAATVLCALAAPANAQQEPPMAVPADAPVVATSASGYAVIAWLHGGRTCATVQAPGQARPAMAYPDRVDAADPHAPLGCVTTPVTSAYDAATLGELTAGADRLSWGYAGLATAGVQLKAGPSRVIATAPTSRPGLLPAPAADLRFWAIEAPAGAPAEDEVALLDAAGVVRRALDPFQFTYGPGASGEEDGDAPTGKVLLRGRIGAATWELRRTRHTVLAATPLALERRATRTCTTFVTRRRHGIEYGSAACDDELDTSPLVVSAGSTCSGGARVVAVTAAAVRRVVVVTGDGARHALPLTALAAGERVGAAAFGPRVALRRVLALDAGGRTLATRVVGLAPTRPGKPCALGYGASDEDSLAIQRLGAAPHTPQFADHGVLLCAAADRAPRIPEECALPPIAPTEADLRILPSGGGRYVLGVVPPEVAAARVTLDDRSTRVLAAQALPYSGIYADAERVVAADVPGPRAITRIELLDDRGRVVNPSAMATSDLTGFDRVVTVLGAANGVPAVRATPEGSFSGSVTCLSFGPVFVPGGVNCDDVLLSAPAGTGPHTIRALARCAPRRLVIWAFLARASDRLVVRTAAGRAITARSVRFPVAAGSAAQGKYLALAVLGPHDAAAEALVRGRQGGRVRIGLPAAGRQCGYAAAPGLMDLFVR